jgi:hypothetical protein
MSGTRKAVLVILGAVSALLIVSQFVMGMLILQGGSVKIRTAHQHSGYLTAAVALAYVLWSLMVIASIPSRPKP